MAQVQNIAKVVRADAASGMRRALPRSWTKAAGFLSARRKTVATEDMLIKLLTKRLKESDILWVPSNFRKAVGNPKLPVWLLLKLEYLIAEAEVSGWKISKTLASELDETVEDIESFNPAYREAIKKDFREAKKDFKFNKLIPAKKLRAEFSAKR